MTVVLYKIISANALNVYIFLKKLKTFLIYLIMINELVIAINFALNNIKNKQRYTINH